LITGGAGYLGRALARSLSPTHELTLFDVVESDVVDASHRSVVGDITNLRAVADACHGQDAVVHTVALVRDRWEAPLERFIDVMVKGTWNVAEACVRSHVKRLINISSVAAGGWPSNQDRTIRPEESLPLSEDDLFYSLAKRLGELVVNSYGEAYGELACINLRPGVIAGDGANPGPSRVDGCGPQWFVYVDVNDVAVAVASALTGDAPRRGTYAIVASRDDALFDWHPATADLGYRSANTWPELR
jgi:nucleoside-diphosphate-sugar epimerase